MKGNSGVRQRAVRMATLAGAALLVSVTASCGVTEYVDEWADAQQRGYGLLDEASFTEIRRSALPLGRTETINGYSVTVTAVDVAADEIVARQFPDARPPAGRYVVAIIEATRVGDDSSSYPVTAMAPTDLEVRYATTDLRTYVRSPTCASMGVRSDNPTPAPLQSDRPVRLTACFEVPAGSAAGGYPAVRANSDPVNDRFTYWRAA